MPSKIENENLKKASLIKSYLTETEKEELKQKANSLNIAVSELVRILVLNLRLPNQEQRKTVDNLLKINADLARLGNLFKLAIDEGASETEMNKLIDEIKETQQLLKEEIKKNV